MMKLKSLFLALLFCVPAVAECPVTVTCPFDKLPMHLSGHCKGNGESQACEYVHSQITIVSGKPHKVVHKQWVVCDKQQ